MNKKTNPVRPLNSPFAGAALVFAVGLFIGCASSNEQPKTSEQAASASAAGAGNAQKEAGAMKETVVAQADTPESAKADAPNSDLKVPEFKVPDETEAKRLAEQHVGLKQYGWGRPTSVTEFSGQYIVTFETPERERVLIGNRAVVVDRKSALVSVQKRR